MTALGRAWFVARIALGFVVFGLGALLLSLLLTTLALLPAASRQRRVRATISLSARLYLKLLASLRLMVFEFPDPSPLNRPGQLVIANHPCLLDAVIMMALMPSACFVVKAATAHNPFTRVLVYLAGYLPNDQFGPDLVARAAELIAAGETLMIFPEGTRTPDPAQLRFQRGAANIALAARCPVQPLHIHMENPALRKHDPWYYLPPAKPHFVMRCLPPVETASQVDFSQPPGLQARQLTRELQKLFETV
jgi:1-acyl-sn-glycerol-3-phosphate acyltransferase